MRIERLTHDLVYANQWIKVYEDKIRRSTGDGLYSVVERGDAVLAIPVTPTGRTLLLDSYRYPTGWTSPEFPMGGVGSGETPIDAVKRELEEETGLTTDKLHALGWFHTLAGLTEQKMFVFRCEVTDEALDHARTPAPAETDDDLVGLRILFLGQLKEEVRAGKIVDSMTLASLTLLDL